MKTPFTPYKQWLSQHDAGIKEEYPDRPTEDLAGEMKVNYYTVSRRAKRLGVAKSDAFMRASWKKGTPQKRIKGKEEMRQYLKARFHDTRNAELAALFGVDVKTVRRMARKLGLEKSEEFMRSVRKKGDWTYYTPEQKAWRNRRIAEAYPEAGQEELRRLAEELGLNYGGLKSIAYSIGVRRSKRVRSEIAARSSAVRKYGPEVIAALAEYYPCHTSRECAEHFGISEGVINQLAFKHKIRKSKEYLHRIRNTRNTQADLTQ